jgi:predicted secreted acid phosphatase
MAELKVVIRSAEDLKVFLDAALKKAQAIINDIDEDMPQASDYGGYNGPKTFEQFHVDMERWQKRQVALMEPADDQA